MSTLDHTEIKPEFKNGRWMAVFDLKHDDMPGASIRVTITGKTEKEVLAKAYQFVKNDGSGS